MSTAVLLYSDVDGNRVKQQVTFDGERSIHRDWVEGVKGRGAVWTQGQAPLDWPLRNTVTTHLTPQERLAVLAGLPVPAVLRRLQVLREQEIAASEYPVLTEAESFEDVAKDVYAQADAAVEWAERIGALDAFNVPESVESPKETVKEPAFAVHQSTQLHSVPLIESRTEAEEAVLDNTAGRGLAELVPQNITPWVERSDGINTANEFTVAEGARADRENLLLYGPTGTGKTHFARACAERWKVPFLIFSGSASGDVETLIGYDQITSGDTHFVQGLLLLAIQYQGGAVICLDEINFFRQDILTPLFPLLDDAKSITVPGASGGQVFHATPGTLIVGTMNPSSYEGTVELNEALKRRFSIRAEWGYDKKVEAGLIKSENLREIANKLRDNKTEVFSDVATPTLVEFEKYATKYGLQFAVSNFVANFERDQEKQIARDLFATYKHNLAVDFGSTGDLSFGEDNTFDEINL